MQVCNSCGLGLLELVGGLQEKREREDYQCGLVQ